MPVSARGSCKGAAARAAGRATAVSPGAASVAAPATAAPFKNLRRSAENFRDLAIIIASVQRISIDRDWEGILYSFSAGMKFKAVCDAAFLYLVEGCADEGGCVRV